MRGRSSIFLYARQLIVGHGFFGWGSLGRVLPSPSGCSSVTSFSSLCGKGFYTARPTVLFRCWSPCVFEAETNQSGSIKSRAAGCTPSVLLMFLSSHFCRHFQAVRTTKFVEERLPVVVPGQPVVFLVFAIFKTLFHFNSEVYPQNFFESFASSSVLWPLIFQ